MDKTISKYLFFLPITYLKGERIGKYLKAAMRFERKSPDAIRQYQLFALRNLVEHSIMTVPYYNSRITPETLEKLHSLEDLKLLPTLTKDDLIKSYHALQSDKKYRLCTTKTTGGSTGQAVTLRKNSTALARERAATARAYSWAGIKLGSPQARLWGIPLEVQDRTYYRIVDLIANRKRISAFNLNPMAMDEYLQTLREFKPEFLYGYASAIGEFVRYLKSREMKLPESLKSIITTSEVLTLELKHQIEKDSGLKVFNEYGCGEVGSIAHECEHGTLHIMSDNLIVEILDESDQPSNEGELVVTDLYNYATPLIRYKLRDFGAWRTTSCPCGRTLPALEKVYGRAYDMIVKHDGSKMHPEILMYAFEAFKRQNMGIKQFQVVQQTITNFRISIVAGPDYKREFERRILSKMSTLLNTKIIGEFEYLETIQREPSGKLRVIKSEVKM